MISLNTEYLKGFVSADEIGRILPSVRLAHENLHSGKGKGFDLVNKKAYEATSAAHFEGGVPNMTITLCKADTVHLGHLYYFLEKACGISGYILGVNPFDQPGVEAYKKKMFALLGKA
jgi:glucose-6-phosphate isomerase